MSDPVLGTMGLQNEVAGKLAPKTGIQLLVTNISGDEVNLEDPDGVNFTVPRAWIDTPNIKMGENVDHLYIAAPPGVLESKWRMAQAEFDQDNSEGGFGGDPTDGDHTESNLDRYDAGKWNPMSPQEVAELRAQWTDADEAAFIDARDFNGDGTMGKSSLPPWNPGVAKELKNPNPTGAIPANAGSNFGNWDETWDSSRGVWVNKYTKKARKP
jgi:hypothetical protein